jgi:hypothetical protein
MWTFFIAGTLYLIGVGVVLVIRPTYMFTSDGAWKEFGIGRNPEQFTWCPFWLFTLFWAILSFFIVQVFASFGLLPGVQWTQIETEVAAAEAASRAPVRRTQKTNDLKPGYYMLNAEGSVKEGVPKYVYIGATHPDD